MKDNELFLFRSKIRDLVLECKKIWQLPDTEPEKWKMIMCLLRDLHLFVHRDYFQKARELPYATINPLDDQIHVLKPKLLRDSMSYSPIFANSHGPYIPEAYFDKTERLLWILSESYLYRESWLSGDKGNNNLIALYDSPEKITEENNPTHKTIFDISSRILRKLFDSELTPEAVMEHVAIIEVNPFPGLAFNDSGSRTNTDYNILLTQWVPLFRELIKFFIDILAPSVVLSQRNTLSSISTGDQKVRDNLFNYLTDHNFSELKSENGYPDAKMMDSDIKDSFKEEFKYTLKNGTTKEKRVSGLITMDDRLWIGLPNQLSHGLWKNEEFNEKFTNWVNELLRLRRTL